MEKDAYSGVNRWIEQAVIQAKGLIPNSVIEFLQWIKAKDTIWTK